jgi:uncharacterized SAM-binding protein YcdF (DUF218 family)
MVSRRTRTSPPRPRRTESGILLPMAGWGKPLRKRLSRRLRSKRVRLILVAASAVFAAFCLLSALLFVFPATGMPARVDAIVVLGGSGDRLDLGMRLAQENKTPYLVLSQGLPWIPPHLCSGRVAEAKVICFNPDPYTTQGEAEGAAKMAEQYGWTSMVLVTTQDQVWRAHLRFQRCYTGEIYGVAAPVAWYHWPYAILHQWAGTVKAETYQRSC